VTSNLFSVALVIAMGQVPNGAASPYAYPPPGGGIPVNGSGVGNPAAGVLAAGDSTGAFRTGDPVYPFDAFEPWVRGYWQEIPAYGGYTFFRPYNYKHVLSQSQVAGGWGMSPTMPYSHEYFRRMQEQAAAENRLSQVRAAAYNAEIARLRAQKDFTRQPELAAPANAEAVTTASSVEMNRKAGVDPASYTRLSRIEELHQRVERQSQDLRALQQALQEEYSRPVPAAAPPVNRGR
jgi:hypothetical protein